MTQSVPRRIVGARSVRVAAWVSALIYLGILTAVAGANPGPVSPSIRGVEQAAGGVMVEWVREPGPARVLGWHIERQLPGGRGLRLTTELVEADLFDSPSRIYRVEDRTASARAGDSVSYRVITIDLELQDWVSDFMPLSVEPAVPPAARVLKTASSVPVPRAMSSSGVGPRVRIVLKEDGLYRLTAAEIAAVLAGYTESQVVTAMAQTNLALTCGGEPVSWRSEAGGAALLFVGQAYRSTYTDRNVYWLEAGPGLGLATDDRTTASVAADPWYWETVRMEENLHYMPYLPGGVADDYFVWDGQQVTVPTTSWQWNTTVPLPDLHPDMPAGTVTAYLTSAYNGLPTLDNHTRLLADSQLLDDRQWAGTDRLVQSGTATTLSGNSVSVTVELLREAYVTTMTVLIDAVAVRYARRMRAQDDQLLFEPEAGTNILTVRGFSTSAIEVFDVTDPLRPVAVAATLAQEGAADWRASWSTGGEPAKRFLAVAARRQPEAITGVPDSVWGDPMTGAPHLVIAPQALAAAATALVTHRQQQGLASLLVPLEDLFDAYAFGYRDPRAIPRFLAEAQTHWDVPPRYVCLAGDGHLDYLDHYGQSVSRPNHIPPILDRTVYDAGTSGSQVTLGLDNPLADTDGDGFPDLAIGRLPAQTPAALTKMIQAIQAYESSDTWKSKLLLISDKDDHDIFEGVRENLAALIPSVLSIHRLGHTASTPTATMRESFIAAMNSAPFVAVYYGHANNVGLSSPYFFEHSYIRSYMSSLTNQTRAPLVLAGTCMLNDFASPHPENRCMGKGFLDTAPGGAVACWAAAAEVSLAMAEVTTQGILLKLFEHHTARLGDLVDEALEIQAASASPWTVRSSVLLGDPGTRIRTDQFSDQTPPEVQILTPTTAPTCSVFTLSLDLTGTASDVNEVTDVWVENSRGGGPVAAIGTTRWVVNGLLLEEGTNNLSVTALDSAGLFSTVFLQVVYTPAPPVPEGLVTEVEIIAGGVALSWTGVVGQSYDIEWADSMFGPFLPLEEGLQATNEHVRVTLMLEAENRRLFFRVRPLP
jgi:Peptidase family C25